MVLLLVKLLNRIQNPLPRLRLAAHAAPPQLPAWNPGAPPRPATPCSGTARARRWAAEPRRRRSRPVAGLSARRRLSSGCPQFRVRAGPAASPAKGSHREPKLLSPEPSTAGGAGAKRAARRVPLRGFLQALGTRPVEQIQPGALRSWPGPRTGAVEGNLPAAERGEQPSIWLRTAPIHFHSRAWLQALNDSINFWPPRVLRSSSRPYR